MKKSKKSSVLKGVALTAAAIGLATVANSAAATMEVNSHGGLCVLDPCESSYWFKIGGLLQLDQTFFAGKARAKRHDFPNGANIRRSWLFLNGGVGDCWSYSITLDFRGDPVVIREAYLNYKGIEQTNIAAGQIFIPFGLENWGEKKDLMFLEQSLMTETFLAPEFGLGVYADTNLFDMFTIAAAVYEPRQTARSFGVNSRVFSLLDDVDQRERFRRRSDRVGEALRVTFSPYHCDDTVYHFGAAVKNQRLVDTSPEHLPVRTNIFQTTPEGLGRTTATLINAGRLRATRFTVGGLEAAALWGPLTIQAEYNKAKVKLHRDNFLLSNFVNNIAVSKTPVARRGGSSDFWGWHVQAGYVLTGESRTYDFPTGTFGGVIPATDCGAWEIAARYSAVNLIDNQVYGGRENNVTVGLNWFVNDCIQIKFNYVRANIHPTNTSIVFNNVASDEVENRVLSNAGTKPLHPHKRRLDIFGLRFQAAFY